jgi:RNA polymerase sigma-70 factor (ECF subfamily)
VLGRDQVTNLLVGLYRTAKTAGVLRDVSLSIEDVNAEPAVVVRVGGRLESLFVFSVEDDAIAGIRAVRNPDKLARIDRQLTA